MIYCLPLDDECFLRETYKWDTEYEMRSIIEKAESVVKIGEFNGRSFYISTVNGRQVISIYNADQEDSFSATHLIGE